MTNPSASTITPPTVDDELRLLHSLPATHPDRARLRAHIIETQLPLARRLAMRFQGKGEPVDDLVQTARTALIKAVDRFDPDNGAPFAGFATPSITGTLKHHFRDHTWAMKVPRSAQELIGELATATEELTHRYTRRPTTTELAAHLGTDPAAVRNAMSAVHAYHLVSLDAPGTRTTDTDLVDAVGTDDPGLTAVDDRLSLWPAITRLPARERRILTMRFYLQMTQAQIGAEIGVSQMQISRLLTWTLKRLHTVMTASTRSM